jgi:hypothetical protein
MDAPGAFKIVIKACDLIENGGSIEEVERTLAQLRSWYPECEVLPELDWLLTMRLSPARAAP